MENLDALWSKILENIKKEKVFDDSVYSSYIENSKLKSIDNNIALIEVPWRVNYLYINENKEIFNNLISNMLGTDIKCNVEIKQETKVLNKTHDDSFLKELGDKINKDYTFDNFIQGLSNQQSYAAAYGCALSTQNSFFNPLFIYGNSGLGKTHLLHAICNYLKSERPDVKYLYIDGNDLIAVLIKATRNRTINNVIDVLSNLDYLLIDDIQHLTKTGDMQELFFNLYNKLISNNSQIVMTSDVYPSDLKNVNKRIISRFEKGLSVSITSPEFETAVSILQKKLEGRNKGINITEDALYFIAHRFNEDVRKLEGALNELLFKAVLFNPPVIDETFAIEVFKDNPIANNGNELTIKKIKKEVCDYYNISLKQIESKSRTADIALARHIAIYLSRELLDIPFKKIGDAFGHRDHSTIMTSYDKIDKMIKSKEIYREVINEIKKRLGIDIVE